MKPEKELQNEVKFLFPDVIYKATQALVPLLNFMLTEFWLKSKPINSDSRMHFFSISKLQRRDRDAKTL